MITLSVYVVKKGVYRVVLAAALPALLWRSRLARRTYKRYAMICEGRQFEPAQEQYLFLNFLFSLF